MFVKAATDSIQPGFNFKVKKKGVISLGGNELPATQTLRGARWNTSMDIRQMHNALNKSQEEKQEHHQHIEPTLEKFEEYDSVYYYYTTMIGFGTSFAAVFRFPAMCHEHSFVFLLPYFLTLIFVCAPALHVLTAFGQNESKRQAFFNLFGE